MQNIENSCAMLEEDKVTKDRQNRRQERDEIQIAEDRCNHLASIDAANSSLVDIARSVNNVDIVKKKLTVE